MVIAIHLPCPLNRLSNYSTKYLKLILQIQGTLCQLLHYQTSSFYLQVNHFHNVSIVYHFIKQFKQKIYCVEQSVKFFNKSRTKMTFSRLLISQIRNENYLSFFCKTELPSLDLLCVISISFDLNSSTEFTNA